MKDNSLAKRYAKALVESVATEKEFESVKVELEQFAEIVNGNSDLKAGMETLIFSKGQKVEVLEALNEKLSISEKTYNFLKTVTEANRMAHLDGIIQVMKELWNEKSGVLELKVSSAVSLDDELEKRLISELEKAFSKKIVLQKETDPSLIAGIRIQKGSIFYDFSINGNLQKLRNALLEEN